jgi:hypothetical protein
VEAGASALRIRLVIMTSANSLSLILRRLDEIERKLDRMLEELRTPTAIGYSARRGNHPRKDWTTLGGELMLLCSSALFVTKAIGPRLVYQPLAVASPRTAPD